MIDPAILGRNEAFPCNYTPESNYATPGMDIRTYASIQILAGLASCDCAHLQKASLAVELADLLLIELAKAKAPTP